jgi:hypothetical protein
MYNRLMGYVGFFLITLMVLTLDGLFKDTKPKPQKVRVGSRVRVITAAGGGFLICLASLFWWFSNSKLMPLDRVKVSNFEVRDLLGVIGFFLITLAGLVMLLQSSRLKQVGALIITLTIYGQLAFSGSNYRAAIPDAYFYPNTAITADLQQVGGRIGQAGTSGLLPAEANIWSNLEQINSYDSLGVRWFEELRQASVKRWPEWNNAVPLNLFNLKQVLAASADPNFQSLLAKDCPQLKRAVKFPGVNIYNNEGYQAPYRLVYQSVSEPEQQAVTNLLDGKINPIEAVVFVKGEDPPELINSPDPQK